MSGAIDVRLLRAATHVEAAAAMADAASAVQLPTWFRRGSAIERLEGQWNGAAAEARRGVAELTPGGDDTADAVRAIAQLADRMTPGRMLRVDQALDIEAIRDAAPALRQHAAMLREQAALHGREPDAVRAALRQELDGLLRGPVDSMTAEQVRRIGEIAAMPPRLRPDFPKPMDSGYGPAVLATDSWPHSFADRARPEVEHLRLDLLRRDLEADPATTRALLDDELRTMLDAGGDLSGAQAERLAIMGRLGDELRPALLDAPRPYSARSLERMLPRDWHRLHQDALRRAIELERIVGDPALDRPTLTSELMSFLVRPDEAFTDADLVRMSAIAAAPERLRPPLRIVDGDVRFAPRNGTVVRPDGIGAPGLFPATRLELVRHDPELAADAVRARLAAGDAVDDAVAIELGASPQLLERAGISDDAFELVADRVLASTKGPVGQARVRSLLMEVERRRMASDPTVTRASLDAELRAIVATPDKQVTSDHLMRMSLIAGMPDELRPALADTPVPWAERRPLSELAAWDPELGRPMLGLSDDARAKLEGLRIGVELERLLADPATSRATVTQELVELLSLPNDELTPQQLRRTSLLARTPEHLRPSLPELGGAHFRLQDLGVLGYHPSEHKAARAVFDTVRVHVTTTVDPDAAARLLMQRITAGEAVDFRVVTALSEQPGVLERHGITTPVLGRAAVHALKAAGTSSRSAIEPQLKMVRDGIVRMETTVPGADMVKAQSLALIDRNLDRLAGRLVDGMAGHPDYAELGRLMSLADLLHALQPATAPAARPGAAAATAAAGTETLVW